MMNNEYVINSYVKITKSMNKNEKKKKVVKRERTLFIPVNGKF